MHGRRDNGKRHEERLEIIVGPAGSGKTTDCLRTWADLAPRALLLVPTTAAVLAVEERLAGENLLPIWGRTIATPGDLASWLTRRAGRPEKRILTHTLKTLLLREVIDGLETSYLREVRNHSGFYRALGRLVSELKGGGISPERFSTECARRRAALRAYPLLESRDREICSIYAEFQRRLEERGWAEREDVAAEAGSLLTDDPNLLAEEYDAVLADGFWTFSAVELDLLRAICAAVPTVKIALPWEEGRDALAYTERTLERLKGLGTEGRQAHVRRLDRCHTGQPASLSHLGRCLFASFSDEERLEAEDGAITFLEAPSEDGEVEMLAREIAGLLRPSTLLGPVPSTCSGPERVEGSVSNGRRQRLRPEEILVVFRDLTPYARHVERLFREYDIPFWLQVKRPLLDIPLARTLNCLLRVICDGWQRRDVVALLKSGYLPIEPEKANWVEVEAHKRGVFRGREEWLSEFAYEEGEQTAGVASLATEAQEANRQKEEALGLVRKVEENLGERPTPATFRATLLTWTQDKAVQKRLAEAEAETVRMDGLALLRIDELLREMEEATGEDWRRLTVRDLANRLLVAMEGTWVEGGTEERGVLCLEAEDAGHFQAEVVFVVGMNEKNFPPPRREEPFYADWEREDIRHLGSLGLRTHKEEAERERLLFYSAATRARSRLYLCRAHTDNKGRDRQESFFLYQLKRLFSPESVKACTARRELSDVVPEEPLTEAETLNLAVADGLHLGIAGPESPGGLRTGVTFAPVEAQLEEVARLANWEPEARLRAGEFEVATVFSPSSLETYASCPFRFFAEEVLGLEPPEEEIGPRERGQLLHRVLSKLLREEEDWHEERRETLTERARDILEEEVRASGYGRRDERGYRLGLLREIVLQLLDGFVEQELKLRLKLPEFRPAGFELSFGYEDTCLQGGDAGRGPLATWLVQPEPALSPSAGPLKVGDSILIRGRIDRLDLSAGGKNCIIYDYKSGKTGFHAGEMREGTSLQIPLYLLAAEDLWGLNPLAGLFYLREGPSSGILRQEMQSRFGFRPAPQKRLVVSDLEQVRGEVVPVVERLVRGIREGCFPALPGDRCRDCTFGPLCRQQRARRNG